MESQHLHNPRLELANEKKLKGIQEIVAPLILSPETVRRIRDVLESEMELGLSRNPARQSCLQMENTFIPELLDGTENGDFLALDLGGTNFRVILLRLRPGEEADFLVKYYTVPEPLRLGEGPLLFDFLAECIYDFLKSNDLLDRHLPLGFTFSFPMVQKGLDVGILVTWTKSFNCPGVVGEDAVKMLNDAIHKRGDLKVDVIAVLNDTTGTLVKGAFLDSKCAIGLILGTGCNACYLEKVERIEKWEGQHPGVDEVIIDIEWGAFGDNGVLDFIKTEFDFAVDAQSLIVNSFTFEKLFGGKFLGELNRQILLKLIDKKLLFGGRLSKELSQHDSLTTTDISMMEGEENGRHAGTKEILKRLGYENATDDDVAIVKYVSAVTSLRGARIVSTCLASLLDRMDKPFVTIAIDGSLYKNHPKFHRLMTDFIAESAPGKKFKLMLAEDGSGKGAGLVAAIAVRLLKNNKKLHLFQKEHQF